MSSTDDLRLFQMHDVLSADALVADGQAAEEPGAGAPQHDLDGARMWRSRDDGFLVRGVKPHSADKSRMVSRGIGTVSTAMVGQWFAREFGLQYVELYSGPGRLLDESTGIELVGSPVQALELPTPFTKYVFSDYSQDCVDALSARVGGSKNVEVLCGDANNGEHLDRVKALLNPRALVIAYLDPARPQDLRWATIEYLAAHFRFVDLIINLPVNSLMRAILGAHSQGHAGPGAAGDFLNHPTPHELLQLRPDGSVNTPLTINRIRSHFDAQLEGLGFRPPARRTVWFPRTNPYYDVLLVSRHPTGVQLWNRTNPEEEDLRLWDDAGG